MNIMTTYYQKNHLLKALKKAKLPCSYHTLIKYEKMGVVKRPGAVLSGSKDRYYTSAEIEDIIKEVREYQKALKKSKKDEKYLINYFKGKEV